MWTQFCPSLTPTYLQVDIFNLERGQKLAFFWPPNTYFCPRSHWMSSLSPMFCSSHIFVFSFPFFPRFAFLALQNVNKDCIIFSYFHIMTSSPKVTKNQKPKMGWTKKKTQRTKQRLSFRSCSSESRCCMFREHTSRDLSNGKNS